jgi:hypothetical protein
MENKNNPQETEEWKEKFRKQFPGLGTMEQEFAGTDSPIFVECADGVEQFISSLLSQKDKEDKNKIIIYCKENTQTDHTTGWYEGYNEALKDLQARLNDKDFGEEGSGIQYD